LSFDFLHQGLSSGAVPLDFVDFLCSGTNVTTTSIRWNLEIAWMHRQTSCWYQQHISTFWRTQAINRNKRVTGLKQISKVMYHVWYSRNRPAMLYLHSSARILTAFINIQVSKYHTGETRTVESARKAFWYRRLISLQVLIFNPTFVRNTYCTYRYPIFCWIFAGARR